MELYLIRHAKADERGPRYPDDSQRPLTNKGHLQTKTLSRLFESNSLHFDQLFSSPYTRAAQTAEPLAERLKSGRYIQYLDALTNSNYVQLLAELKEWTHNPKDKIGLVGHEPYLSELAAYLLTSTKSDLSINFKKAAFMCLQGELEPGEMTLTALIPVEWF